MTGARARAWSPAGAAALVLVVHAVLLTAPVPAGLATGGDDLAQLLAASASACCCAVAARRSTRRTRAAWVLLTAATASWAAGQAVWSYQELVAGQQVLFPTPADAGFVLFPVLAAVGLLVMPTGTDSAGTRLRDLLDGLVTAGSLLVLSWASGLGGLVAAGGPSRAATALGVAYPLGDVVVLTLVVLVLGRTARRRRAVLVPLTGGLAALAVADSSFLYLTAGGEYTSGALCGLGWTSGFALVALAALAVPPAARRSAEDRPGPPVEPLLVPSRLRLTLPYVPLLLAQGTVTWQLLTGEGRASAFEVTLGLALVVLVLARQFLTLADNRTLLLTLRGERETARYAALHDPLTGLANRTLFHDRVAHALAAGRPARAATTVLFCDLDDFKTVNDGLGHAVGDALLVAVADRLRSCLRPGDTAARLGGDEFAVLVEDGTEPPDALAARLVAALGRPLALDGRQVRSSVSVGVASTCPAADEGIDGADGIDGAELLRRADTAMYAAKASGGATWVAHDTTSPDPHRRGADPVPAGRVPAGRSCRVPA